MTAFPVLQSVLLVTSVYGSQFFLHKLMKMGICACSSLEGNHPNVVCSVTHTQGSLCSGSNPWCCRSFDNLPLLIDITPVPTIFLRIVSSFGLQKLLQPMCWKLVENYILYLKDKEYNLKMIFISRICTKIFFLCNYCTSQERLCPSNHSIKWLSGREIYSPDFVERIKGISYCKWCADSIGLQCNYDTYVPF